MARVYRTINDRGTFLTDRFLIPLLALPTISSPTIATGHPSTSIDDGPKSSHNHVCENNSSTLHAEQE